MTVQELIDELQEYPKDMEVDLYTGIFRVAEAAYTDIQKDSKYVTIYGKEE